MDNAPDQTIVTPMSDQMDIVIAGGGLNGSAMALALASAGFRVMLADTLATDTRMDDAFDGRGYALSVSSKRVLSALGVWAEVADQAQPILDIKISDGRIGQSASPFVLEFDHAEIEEGPMGFMIEDRHLRRALLAALEADDRINHRAGLSVSAHETDDASVMISLSDGTQVRAGLLIGADGKSSATAARAGIRRTGWAYGQTSLVCALEHALPHEGLAYQHFLPSGPLAILPLPGNRVSIVWTEAEAAAARISAMDDEAYLEQLRVRMGGVLGEIGLVGKRFSFPLSLSLADDLVAPRVALVGDAAHAVHPIAGQGLNAGLKDVAALADVLAEARARGEDFGQSVVLGRYQTWRRFDIAALATATDAFNRLFSNDNPILRIGRDIGLGLAGALPGLRRTLIREAAGLTGDLPRLSRGVPLDQV